MNEAPTKSESPEVSPASSDEIFMSWALDEARLAESEGEVPVGCVIEMGGKVIAAAHNRPIGLHDPTAHAEILTLREAARLVQNYRLPEATLYVTIEPCAMCVGAMLHARVKRLVYGAADAKAGAVTSVFQLATDERLNHRIEVTGGVLEERCRAAIQNFFAQKRA